MNYNKNCLIVRNTKKGVYGRCKYCNLKIHQCFAMQANIIIFFVIALVLIFVSVYRNNYVIAAGLLILALLLVLAKVIDEKTNVLILSEYTFKQSFKEQLKVSQKRQDVILNMLEELRESKARLKRTYDELKDIDRMKTNIIANVSHELKTPITIVTGVLDLAMDGGDKEARNELLRRGKTAIARQEKVVENLIEASRLVRQSYEFKLTSFDISDVVLLSVRETGPNAEKKDIKVKTSIPGDIPKVRADFSAVKRVLDNLLDNAIKFNKEGGEVLVSAKNRGNFVEMSVKDTGIGIPAKDVHRIFNRLYQVDSDSTRMYSGTGMGLAVAKDIIESNKGKIWVESERRKGSTFYFTLSVGET